MSTLAPPDPAKLVIGILTSRKELCSQVMEELEHVGGPLDMVSKWLEFDFTSYYENEMGAPLFRRFAVFQQLVDQGSLGRIKLLTNEVETLFMENANRQVNIDPGCMLSSRFILATGKDFAHRIYIGSRVYADLTLLYRNKQFVPLDWTYPDYASPPVIHFLKKVRQKYKWDLHQQKKVKP